MEAEEEFSDQSDLVELLQELLEHPLDLNWASFEQLQQIPGLSPTMARRLIEYRDKMGMISSLKELRKIQGIDEKLIQEIKPFVTIQEIRQVKPLAIASRSRLMQRVERSEGFRRGVYYNSPQKYYCRMRLKFFEKVEAGCLLEKDSGERRLDDLNLHYLKVEGLPLKGKILLGHYRLEFAQGLVLWSPYGFSKGSQAIYPVRKTQRNLREYFSTDENAFLFGAAVNMGFKGTTTIAFYSTTKLDANVKSSGAISSFYPSGYHRNERELAKKDALKEEILGSRISLTLRRNAQIGVTFYSSAYDKDIQNDDYIRKRFTFRGRTNWVAGFDWNVSWRDMNLFGEAAQSKGKGWGAVLGSIVDFGRVDIALLCRNYQKDFHSPHSFGFADRNGVTQNEQGIYYGLRYRITNTTLISAYYDQFKHPWRTYYDPLPTSGVDFLAQLQQRLGKRLKLTLRTRFKREDEARKTLDAYGRETTKIFQKQRQNFRVELEVRISAKVKIRGRAEGVVVNYSRGGLNEFNPPPKSSGVLLYQDVRIRPFTSLTLHGRFTFFNTDSYHSRLYQFENDLPGVMTNRALYGKGYLWYVLLSHNFLSTFKLSLKYLHIYHHGVESFGSGYDKIQGNMDRRVGIQLDMKI